MGSQVIKVLRQGVWASLTGGWYYDPRHSKFANVFHMYTWLILLCLPLIFYMVPAFAPDWAIVGTYAVTVFTLFAGIKITNYRLHTMFDEGEIVERKVVSEENQSVAVDHLVSEDNGNTADAHQAAGVEIAFPVAGSTDALERREREEKASAGDASTLKINKDLATAEDSSDKLTTKRDLEVDVHIDPQSTGGNNNNESNESADNKKQQKKRRHRQRLRSEKAVNFAETSVQTERLPRVGRCISLPSASSDTDKIDTDEQGRSTDSVTDDSNDTTESSEDNVSCKDGPLRVDERPRSRPIRRRAVRGLQKHPWYNKPKSHTGSSKDSTQNTSTSSSGCSDDWAKTGDNSKDTSSQQTAESSQRDASKNAPRRKRTPEVGTTLSPQRKLPALDPQTAVSSRLLDPSRNTVGDDSAVSLDTTQNLTHERDCDREHATSDQELITRDPVWRARRSRRYSSDRRLFFRRSSYTVNSHRSRERDGRRRVSTVPPYNDRRASPPRRAPSSLHKLMNLWNRDPRTQSTQNNGTASPGQLSPGEVVLTGHSISNNEFQEEPSSPGNVFFPTAEIGLSVSKNNNASVQSNSQETGLDSKETTRPKSENGSSRNANPHCNEVSTPKKEVQDSQETVASQPQNSDVTSLVKNEPKLSKRVKSGIPNLQESSWLESSGLRRLSETRPGLNGLPVRPGTPIPSSGLAPSHMRLTSDSPEEDEFDEDLQKFVNNLIGATATWQETSNQGSSADQETGLHMQARRRSSPGEARSNREDFEVEKINVNLHGEELLAPSESRSGRRPRLSLPVTTERAAGQVPQPRPSAPIPWRPRSYSGRRVRHPAGTSESHPKLTSNTSEDVGAAVATTSQQISGNSMTSTTELLAAGEDEIPPEVMEKMAEAEDTRSVHIATQHDDTSAGATHAFQDEHGNWFTYTFGEASGTAQALNTASSLRSSRNRLRHRTHSSVQSGEGDTSDEARSAQTSQRDRTRRITFPSLSRRLNQRQRAGMDLSTFLESDLSESFTQADWPEISHLDFILNNPILPPRRAATPRVKLFYRFKILPFKSIILQYDRLALLDLLDRNLFVIENIFAMLLALVVAVLGLVLLQKGFFLDLWPLWFCAVIATAQYSLIRSVQPDSASPTHGHNRVIAYSRPVYFIALALLIILFDFLASDSAYVPDQYIYAGLYFTKASCAMARSVLLVLIMILPFIFLLGLLPQINTFLMYLAEQTEIHMFGGSACTSLTSALYSVGRSLLFCLPLFGFCYGGMKNEEGSQHILFSVFCGLLVSFSYHLSRQTNNVLHLWELARSKFFSNENAQNEQVTAEDGDGREDEQNPDKLSAIYVQGTLSERIRSDLIICPLITISMFAIHCSTPFTVLQPALTWVLYIIAGILGFLNHYLLPQLRKQLPWLLFSSPILKTKEYNLFEIQEEAQVMWFEKVCIWLSFVERNVVYPLVIMNELTRDASAVTKLYGLVWGCVILTFVGLKLLRTSYNVTLMQFSVLIFSALFTNYDAQGLEDPTIITYFLVSILFIKLQDMLLKLQFIFVYIAPWQITWGSAFHAFAQPFSVPHSGMLLLHTAISSFLQAPLAPFLGSAVFLTSYVRPLKFWERTYNTKRVDHSNTRLASQIDRGPSSDDNNLNSIFYEHLTLSLQKSLCGDIAMGRWGNVYPGDCFIMASDYLNALVHIIQKGNGVITFQLRGLEFSGTYCQQREVEAISEGVDDNFHCCCFHTGHPKNMLSFNAAFNQRWLAWQVQTTKFVLDGYSITDNSATSMLGVYDLRKILLSYIVKSVIYFLVSHESLDKWLAEESIQEAMKKCEAPDYVDVDPSFSVTIHDDYDMWLSGISRTKFQVVYGKWIAYCSSCRKTPVDADADSKLVTLCYMISVLSRRALGTASTNLTASHVVLESFLYGLHSLFKGDFRITASKDEWVFSDMDLLHHVVAPGVRMSLKLHQDHFQSCLDDDEDYKGLYDVITENMKEMVITHEADPQWRKAVLSNRTSLLALRHVAGDAVDSYFVITLKRRSQGFRIVRVNRECVKGLWAGQQQELVFLRNSNPERGSIQNAKQVLRNMINSSCDQPIGYPIYVSPVTTSFSDTHPQYRKITRFAGVYGIRRLFSCLWACIQQSCGGGCNSGGSAGINVTADLGIRRAPPPPSTRSTQAPSSVRTSVTGSQSSGNQPNVQDQGGPTNVRQVLRSGQPLRSLSHECRHVGRSLGEDYGSSSVFMSSTSLSGARSSSRWRMGPDGNKISGNRHPSGTGSMEMSTVNPKFQGSAANRLPRNSRREGPESAANTSTAVGKSLKLSFTSEEPRAPQNTVSSLSSSNLKSPKNSSASGPSSSASSSTSRVDSPAVVAAQIASVKSNRKTSFADGMEADATSSGKSRNNPSRKESKQELSKDAEKELVTVTDVSRVFETLEIHRQIDFVKWPNDEWRKRGGRSKWGDWRPKKDMVGEVVHRWYPSHRNPNLRSHVGEVIALLRIEDFYVPIPEKCITPFKPDIETTQF